MVMNYTSHLLYTSYYIYNTLSSARNCRVSCSEAEKTEHPRTGGVHLKIPARACTKMKNTQPPPRYIQ